MPNSANRSIRFSLMTRAGILSQMTSHNKGASRLKQLFVGTDERRK